MQKKTFILGALLLLSPGLFALYLASRPGYEPNLGMLLGLTFIFWGGASFVGWLMTLTSIHARKKWLYRFLATALAFGLNAGALVLLDWWEDRKMEAHFESNRKLLEQVGSQVLDSSLNLAQANTLLKQRGIIFTLKASSFTDSTCKAAHFYARGALDTQLGYWYLPAESAIACSASKTRARRVAPHWLYGPLQ